jgi:DNA-binding CsgD family transcriptional regulator
MTVRKTLGPSPVGGGPSPLTGTEFAVLRQAAHGDTYAVIAMRMGYTHKSVSKIALRLARKLGARNITHAVYLACQKGLLGVDAPRPRDTEVLAEPSIRLVQSLMAEGFSLSFIAQHMVMGQPELSVLMGRKHITPTMAARIRRAFTELAGRDPLKAGVHPRGRTRALNRARAEGWEIIPAEEQARLRGTHSNAA